jgi:hypothetical protein
MTSLMAITNDSILMAETASFHKKKVEGLDKFLARIM